MIICAFGINLVRGMKYLEFGIMYLVLGLKYLEFEIICLVNGIKYLEFWVFEIFGIYDILDKPCDFLSRPPHSKDPRQPL